MPSLLPHPDGPDINRAVGVLAAEWVLVSISTVVVLLRLYAKSRTVRKIGWDDYIVGLATLLAISHGAVMHEAFHYGWGRHEYYLDQPRRIQSTKWIFISQGHGVLSPMFGRVAFCVYLYNILGVSSPRKRQSLIATIVLQLAINISCTIMIYTQCGTNLQALWNPSVKAVCLSADVQTNYGYVQSAINSLSDLYLTVLPALIVWGMQTKISIKLGLTALLSLSVFAFIASVVKTYEIHILGERGDLTWNFVTFVIWASLEVNIVIIATSIPTLRPLFKRRSKASTLPIYEVRSPGSPIRSIYGKHASGHTAESTSVAVTSIGSDAELTTSNEAVIEPQRPGQVRKTTNITILSSTRTNEEETIEKRYGW